MSMSGIRMPHDPQHIKQFLIKAFGTDARCSECGSGIPVTEESATLISDFQPFPPEGREGRGFRSYGIAVSCPACGTPWMRAVRQWLTAAEQKQFAAEIRKKSQGDEEAR